MKRKDDTRLCLQIVQGIFGLILLVMVCFSFIGCGSVQQIPVNNVTKIEYRDTTIFLRDTITVEVPKEVVREVLPQMDTSVLRTTLAESVAYLDTTKRQIKHTLEQKGELRVEYDTIVKYDYIDRYIEKEVPIEVVKEVKHIPNWCWISLIFNVITLCYIAFKIYVRFKI